MGTTDQTQYHARIDRSVDCALKVLSDATLEGRHSLRPSQSEFT